MKHILVILLLFLVIPAISFAKTVRYDDPNVPKELNTLRKFRDFHLKKYKAGRAFIRYYYKYGPTAAKAISKRERLKSLVRLSLLPLMYAGKNFDGVLLFLKLFLAFAVMVIVSGAYTKIKRRAVQ